MVDESTEGTLLRLRAHTAVGSISAGSTQLTLLSNPGFVVTDPIIIEIGNEIGAGMRGTKGVGGAWPELSYPNIETLKADTATITNTYAWTEDTGDVFRRGMSEWSKVDDRNYYTAKAIPKALIATIIAIDGLMLTLNTAASVASNNANVYFDNSFVFNSVGEQGSNYAPENNLLICPSGKFAVSRNLTIQGHKGWIITGHGKNSTTIFSPKGTPSAKLQLIACAAIIIRNLHLQGNFGANGFGLNLADQTTHPHGESYPSGIRFERCQACQAIDLKITDVFQAAVGASFCHDVWAIRCEVFVTVAPQQYIQWMILWADSEGGGIIDCAVISAFLIAGFEVFRSNAVRIIRPVLRNACMSSNSSGNFLIDTPKVTIESNSQFSEVSFSKMTPIININSNIFPPNPSIRWGGIILNPTIIQEGYINGNKDSLRNIVINANNPNIRIEGGYPDDPAAGGLIQSPDYVAGSFSGGGGGIIADNAAVSVSGVRVVGTVDPSKSANIKVASGSTVTSCVADVIIGGSQSRNMTNADWEKSIRLRASQQKSNSER